MSFVIDSHDIRWFTLRKEIYWKGNQLYVRCRLIRIKDNNTDLLQFQSIQLESIHMFLLSSDNIIIALQGDGPDVTFHSPLIL